MLTGATRNNFHTLLDAIPLHSDAESPPAIIYLSTTTEPITVNRSNFKMHVLTYAASMAKLGIAAGDLVIIAHTQSLESIYAFWGALWLGAIPSMFPTLTEKLDPDIYMRDLGELVHISGVKAILTTDHFASRLKSKLLCPVYSSEELLLSTAPQIPHAYKSSPSDIALLQHSSGTTGLQKGVALSHKAILNQLASYADALKLTSEDIIVSWLPLYHDMGLIAGFLQPLIQGIPLVLMSPFDWVSHPAMLLRAIHDYHATLCWLPNFAYNHSTRAIRQSDTAALDLSTIRAFINCSEPVQHESHLMFAERFAANGIRMDMFTVSYAMAENTFAVTQTKPGNYPAIDTISLDNLRQKKQAIPTESDKNSTTSIVSCGAPIPNVEVKVVDANGKTLPDRHIGEVLVRSDSMLSGYFKRPDLNPFDDQCWYRTGDQGYIADGEIYIVGRSKDLIINAGKNIYPQDIEAVVNTIEGIHPGRVVVFGVPDAAEGTELIAVVAEVETTDKTAQKQISQAIRQQVVRQSSVTVNFVTLVNKGWLIKTSSGKIARGKNREKWMAEKQMKQNP